MPSIWQDMTPRRHAPTALGVEQGTSADIAAYDGNENTLQAAARAEETWPRRWLKRLHLAYPNTDRAPVPRWHRYRLLYSAQTVIKSIIPRNAAATRAADRADECWYWTSTEVEGQQTVKAWYLLDSQRNRKEIPKTRAHKNCVPSITSQRLNL